MSHLCGWIERIPAGTRQNDGLESGIMGATAATIACCCSLLFSFAVQRVERVVRPNPEPEPNALVGLHAGCVREPTSSISSFLTSPASSPRACFPAHLLSSCLFSRARVWSSSACACRAQWMTDTTQRNVYTHLPSNITRDCPPFLLLLQGTFHPSF